MKRKEVQTETLQRGLKRDPHETVFEVRVENEIRDEVRTAPVRAAFPEEPFVQLFVETEPALRAFIFSQIPNWADMSEILQQTSIVLWQKFDQYEQGTDFRNWAFKVARYEVLNFLRKQSRSRLVFSDEVVELLAVEDPAQEDRLERQRHILAECLQKLKPGHRELVQQFYQPDRSMEKLAEIYRKNAMTLYQRVHRLRVLLMACVKKQIQLEEKDFA